MFKLQASGNSSLIIATKSVGDAESHSVQFNALSVAEARLKATELSVAVEHGNDPAAERSAYDQSVTFRKLCERILTSTLLQRNVREPTPNTDA